MHLLLPWQPVLGRLKFIMSHHLGHISFSADPGRRCRRDKFVSAIFLKSVGGILPGLHGYITGTSQRAD